MIKYLFIIFFVFISVKVIAAPLLTSIDYVMPAPPKTEDVKSLYMYLNIIYGNWNKLQVTTQEPNVNFNASYGNIIIYYNGTNYYLCVETTAPSGTTWKGVVLGSV